jgi:predicted xylose isomerase-like sugar epimerase
VRHRQAIFGLVEGLPETTTLSLLNWRAIQVLTEPYGLASGSRRANSEASQSIQARTRGENWRFCG